MPANEILFIIAFAIMTIVVICDVFFAERKNIICRFNRESILEGVSFSWPFLGRIWFSLLVSVPVLLLTSIILAPTLNPEVSWFRNFLGDVFVYILYLMFVCLYALILEYTFRFIQKLKNKYFKKSTES